MKCGMSLIVPAYNSAGHLPALIAALKKQTVMPMEMILVDDCSRDNTAEIASSFFKVLTTPKNSGPAVARNVGMKAAKGSYFGFLDADCIPGPDWVEQADRFMTRFKDPVITGGTYVAGKTWMGKSIAALGYPGGAALGFDKMWRVSPEGYVEKISSANLVIRRDLIESLGRFDESFDYSFEDAFLAYSLKQAGFRIRYRPEIDVEHVSMESFAAFVRWHYRRGQGLNKFRDKVGGLGSFVNLRLWSTKNMIRKYRKDIKLPWMLFLLMLSIVVQKLASAMEKRRRDRT